MITCVSCGTRFPTRADLTTLVESPTGLYRVHQDEPLQEGEELFRGCPQCMTDAYLFEGGLFK